MRNIRVSLRINDVVDHNYSLSPNNYGNVSIISSNLVKISDFLKSSKPFEKGEEPGTNAYVKESSVKFLRNSCIDRSNFTYSSQKLIYLNPNYNYSSMIENLDVLLCKDANIGDSCIYLNNNVNQTTVFSSGIVKPNFNEEKHKYYCLAFFKDDYFLDQLHFKTPKGSTIRHSKNLFMDCLIPRLSNGQDWVFDAFENLIKNIAYSEKVCYEKIYAVNKIIDEELIMNEIEYTYPSINDVIKENRLDAGIYSKEVHGLYENIKSYKSGYSTLDSYGFRIKRGVNLAKRDLGRSIQTNEFRPNYNILVYPSDISEGGYVLNTSYIGSRNPIWFLDSNNILFSAEGTVGKTFIICDDKMKFITNFHGIILYPESKEIDIKKSIFLGLFLNYLRIKGIFAKLSVGGQGGSFAVGYWDSILIPNFPEKILNSLSEIYNRESYLEALKFKIQEIQSAGIFQLNGFRTICCGMLTKIINDLKDNNLQTLNYYKEQLLST